MNVKPVVIKLVVVGLTLVLTTECVTEHTEKRQAHVEIETSANAAWQSLSLQLHLEALMPVVNNAVGVG